DDGPLDGRAGGGQPPGELAQVGLGAGVAVVGVGERDCLGGAQQRLVAGVGEHVQAQSPTAVQRGGGGVGGARRFPEYGQAVVVRVTGQVGRHGRRQGRARVVCRV